MDDVTRNRIAAFDRCEQWFHYNAAGVNTIGKLKNLALEFKTKLSTLQNTTGAHSGAVSESQEQADAFEAGAPSPRRQTRTHRRLHHRKRLESDIAALASWKSASHVEVPPKKKAPPTP